MSAPDKPDPVKAWLLAERLLDEEGDRMAALSDEDFDREMDAMPGPRAPAEHGGAALLSREESERARGGGGRSKGRARAGADGAQGAQGVGALACRGGARRLIVTQASSSGAEVVA